VNLSDFNASNTTVEHLPEAVEKCTETCVDPAWQGKAAFFSLLVTLFLAYLDIEHSDELPGHTRIGLHITTLFSVTTLGLIVFKLGGA
jgi:hypothetical protein